MSGPERHRRIQAAEGSADLLLYDEIGYFGVRAADFIRELRGIHASTIHLRVNSPGGDVIDAVAIYNALREHPARVVAHIDALAASAASMIVLAANEVRMAENALYMIHEPWSVSVGTAEDHRKTADVIDTINDVTLVAAYVAASGQKESVIRDWMAEETWFTAAEALEAGFLDAVDGATPMQASFDPERFQFRHAPAALAAFAERPTARTLERALRDAGLSRTAAKAVLAGGVRTLEEKQSPLALRRDAGGADDEVLAATRRLLGTLNAGAAIPCRTP